MFKYNIINKPKFNIDTSIVDKIFNIIYKIIDKKQKGILNIVFLDDDSIKKLNKDYRKIDKLTDVLSFHYFDSFENLKKNDIAGEIILSENMIKIQALEYGLGKEKEFYKLLIHSVLHILGYDHENDAEYLVMQNIENIIYNKVFD